MPGPKRPGPGCPPPGGYETPVRLGLVAASALTAIAAIAAVGTAAAVAAAAVMIFRVTLVTGGAINVAANGRSETQLIAALFDAVGPGAPLSGLRRRRREEQSTDRSQQ